MLTLDDCRRREITVWAACAPCNTGDYLKAEHVCRAFWRWPVEELQRTGAVEHSCGQRYSTVILVGRHGGGYNAHLETWRLTA